MNNEIPHVNRKFAIIVISVFVAVLLLPTIAWGVLNLIGIANPSVMETVDFDTGENRTFVSFPDSFNPQTFTSEVETWYNDHLPFRSVLYKTQNNLENLIEAPYDQFIRPALIKFFHPESANPTPTPTPIPGGDEIFNPFDDLEATPSANPEDEVPPTPEILNPEDEVPPTPEILNPEDEVPPTPEIQTPENETPSPSETQNPGTQTCAHAMDGGKIEREATCTDWGTILYSCEKCDYAYREYTNKIPHNYSSNVTKLPVCGTKYEETITCSACGISSTTTMLKEHTAGRQLAVVEPSFVDYGYTLIRCQDCKGEYRTNLSNKLYDTSYFPPIYRSGSVTEGRFQWLFFRGDDSESYYAGTNLMSNAQLRDNTSVLERLNEICKEKGITLQIAIFPNKDQVYSEYMPTTQVQNEYKRVERFVDYVKENTDVKIVYPLEELLAAKPYWDLYFQYDTHWNNAGAFIGLQAMYKDLGLETTNLMQLPVRQLYDTDSDYGKYVYDGDTSWIYGTQADMISLGGLDGANYGGRFNYVIDYRPEVTVFSRTGAADPWSTRHTTSNGPNDLNFVMLGDSYRAFMTTHLEKDFTDCLMTHRDKLFDPDVLEAVKNADILVLSAVERYEPDIIQTANELIQILSGE